MSQTEKTLLPVSKKWLVDGFCWYSKRMVAKQFISFGVQKELLDVASLENGAPIIAYANHASWWDPIAAMLLQQAYMPSRTFYAPIDAEALEKYRIMAQLGFYGVRMQTFDGASQFLKITKSILDTEAVTIWLTPEGQFADVRDHSVPLMPGLSHLAAKIPGVRFLPVAFEYGFWNESRPQIFARLGAPISSDQTNSKSEWNDLLNGNLRQTQNELAQGVRSRDPGAFEYLIASRPVRLGWYDYVRSWSAWFRGKSFDPRHSV